MAGTVEEKLSTLIDAKGRITSAIVQKGVDVPTGTPFVEFGELIKLIGDTPETSDMQDIFMMVDVIHDLGIRPYNEYSYTDADIQEVDDLVTFILEGGTENE